MDKRIIPHSKITIGKEEIKAVVDGLKHHHLANGPIVEKFEKDFSIFLDKDYSIGVNSGSSALHLALIALNIKPGDEIILPSYVCTSVLNAI
jgi:dTDP-4-amino-4,6-dideoxygalactose transaminase